MFKSHTPLFLDDRKKELEGSIAIIEQVTIGGIKQTIMIRGRDRHQPILLFLHGGPGFGQIGFIRRYQEELENHFVIVHWDQRGAGKSNSYVSPATFTIDQFVSDTHELIQYLLNRFQQNKIYLVGHNWGSIIGILTASLYPELIHAYIGMSQLVEPQESEWVSYQLTLDHSVKTAHHRATKQLYLIGDPPYRRSEKRKILYHWLNSFGGVIRFRSFSHMILSGFISSEYTWLDWWKWKQGQSKSSKYLSLELKQVNLYKQVPKLEVPFFLMMGRYDVVNPVQIQEHYFHYIEAPIKEIIWYHNSAHFPHIEEPIPYMVQLLRIKENIHLAKRKGNLLFLSQNQAPVLPL
ncbi:alpha/beta fold hydrolase [Hazenella coriacea]|nr:alpha/beta hydrolase [Hazenella coriacea]